MTMPDLPTCWYCERCGRTDLAETSYWHQGCGESIEHYGKPVQMTLVPVAASGEQRRILLTHLGYEVREGMAVPDPLSHVETVTYYEPPSIFGVPVLVLRDQRETTEGTPS